MVIEGNISVHGNSSNMDSWVCFLIEFCWWFLLNFVLFMKVKSLFYNITDASLLYTGVCACSFFYSVCCNKRRKAHWNLCTPERIQAGTRWQTFCRQHYQIHFLIRIVLYFISQLMKFVPIGRIDNKQSFILVKKQKTTTTKQVWSHSQNQWWSSSLIHIALWRTATGKDIKCIRQVVIIMEHLIKQDK